MPDVCMWTKIWRSGSGWHSQMVAQAIAEAGAKIVFISPAADPRSREPSHPNVVRVLTPRELITGGPRLSRISASLSRMLTGAWAAVRQRPRTKVYLLTIPEPLLFTLPLMALLRLSGASIVFQVHDAKPHAWRTSGWLQPLERFLHLLSYRLSSHLVCLTDATRTALVAEFGCSPDRITVIPHGPFEVAEPSRLPGNQRLLAFGSLRRNKNILAVIEGVIEARRIGHDVSLLIAGEPLPEERGYWDECLSAIASDPTAFVVRRGFVAEEDIPGLISDTDAFVLAYEDFASQSGVGVLAAMAGRPVLGTASGGLADLYQSGMVGPVISQPISAKSIATSIAEFCSRPTDSWQSMATEGRDRVAATISWSRVGDDYVRLINALRAGRRIHTQSAV